MSTHDAGRELDIFIAKRIMGWTVQPWIGPVSGDTYFQLVDSQGVVHAAFNTPIAYDTESEAWRSVPAYSTEIAAAWTVVEYLRDLWTEATAGVSGLDNSFVRPFDDTAFFEVLHRNADRRWPWAFLYVTPLAICRAALAAVAADGSLGENT